MTGSRLYTPYDFRSEFDAPRKKKRFACRPYAKKARRLFRERLDSLDQLREDPEALEQLVSEMVGPDPRPLKAGEWRTTSDWDRRIDQARSRLVELLDMNVIDLMNLLVEA